jgi:uncharacterized alpha/beta hydrolase family protein
MEIFVFLFTYLMFQNPKKQQKTKTNQRHRAKDEYKINFLHVYSPSVTSMTGLISEPGNAGPLS